MVVAIIVIILLVELNAVQIKICSEVVFLYDESSDK